jgi:hypothetical protein
MNPRKIFVLQYEFSIITPHTFLDRDISVEVTGLGILDWLVSHITTWVIDLFHDEIVGALESQLRDYIKAVLPSITPDVFFK